MPATLSDTRAASSSSTASDLPDRMYSDHDVSELFGVCVITVRRWLKAGLLPQPIMIGTKRYWHPATLARAIAAESPSIPQCSTGQSPAQGDWPVSDPECIFEDSCCEHRT